MTHCIALRQLAGPLAMSYGANQMISDEIISAISRFFDGGKGPSHDELTRMFRRAGLEAKDPQEPGGAPVGKMKRCREVLSQALDENPAAGEKLIKMVLGTVKASGGFRPESDNYAGDELVSAVRKAFQASGYELDPEGNIRTLLLENLDHKAAGDALHAYVRRARMGSADAALVVGTGKDLLEATARHVLVRKTGAYPAHANFPATLFQAFEMLNLGNPDLKWVQDLDPKNAMRGVEQALCLLGMAVNRLRNAEGTGHGRPYLPSVSDDEAHVATQAMGIISEYLLKKMK